MDHRPLESIAELSRRLEIGEVNARELTEHSLERIEQLNPRLNAYVALTAGRARADADEASHRARDGRRRGSLDGIAIAVKDNIDVAGVPTGNGLGGAHAPARADAVCVARLNAAGAVILGKLNMHEAALGGTTDNVHTGRTINSWRDGFTPGGSSGGSGAAVAAGLCVAALGTDTGGSVRLPAAYCGVTGLKPGHGVVSLQGVALLSPQHDHVGVLARSATDALVVLEAMAEAPLGDYALRPAEPTAPLDGLTLARLANFEREATEPEIARLFDDACRMLERLGARLVTLSIPDLDPMQLRRTAFAAFEITAAAEHWSRCQAEPTRYSSELTRYLAWGARVPDTQRREIEASLAAAAAGFTDALARVDAIVSPTAPQAAFAFGQPVPANQSSFTLLANLAGTPAVSVPMGLTASGLPAGLQICTAAGLETKAVALGAAYERATDWRLLDHAVLRALAR